MEINPSIDWEKGKIQLPSKIIELYVLDMKIDQLLMKIKRKFLGGGILIRS